MSAAASVLVLGIGNPDRGDDGVGACVVAALRGRLPDGVELRTHHGDMLGLLDAWAGARAVVCIDAAAPAGAPGCVHRLDLAVDALPRELLPASGHALGLAEAVALARALGAAPRDIVVYAVEGRQFAPGSGLDAAVLEAVETVARRVCDEVARLRG
jgi:hydrogenase maturation protease